MVKVLKFGGTSVGDAPTIRKAVAIIRDAASTTPVVVVVSAMSGVSNALIDAARLAPGWDIQKIDGFINELASKHKTAATGTLDGDTSAIESLIDKRLAELRDTLLVINKRGLAEYSIDKVAAYGEKLSAPMVSACINEWAQSEYLYGDDGLIITDDQYTNAEPMMGATSQAVRCKLFPLLEQGIIPVVTGFMGCTPDGRTTLLGRGSSDHISAILGACLDAEEVQIWTDVDGLLTADPKVVENSRLIERISFNEASELAYFGAKVLHPRTVLPAMDKGIPIRILNTFNPTCPGTLIVPSIPRQDRRVTAITLKKGITLVEIVSSKMQSAYGYLARIFEIFSRNKVSIDMLSTTEVSVSLTLDPGFEGKLSSIEDEINKFARIKILHNRALVCVIGEGMESIPGIAGKVFSCLGREGINVECISQGALEINISFVVDETVADKAVRLLHKDIFESDGWNVANQGAC